MKVGLFPVLITVLLLMLFLSKLLKEEINSSPLPLRVIIISAVVLVDVGCILLAAWDMGLLDKISKRHSKGKE